MKNTRFLEIVLFFVLFGAGVAIARFGTGYQAQTLFQMAMITLLAIGWNIISGFTGYVSFGQVAFFGLGAYLAAVSILNFDVPWYAAAAIAALGAGVLAVPLGMIMLRLNGIFFALGMFGLARILQLVANSLDVTGGPMGTTVPVADSPQMTALVAVLAVAAARAAVLFPVAIAARAHADGDARRCRCRRGGRRQYLEIESRGVLHQRLRRGRLPAPFMSGTSAISIRIAPLPALSNCRPSSWCWPEG